MKQKAIQLRKDAPSYFALGGAEDVPLGCDQTEVGLKAKEWSLVPLQSISDFITKGSTPTTYGFNWEESGILFLRSECVSPHGLDLDQSMFISPAAHDMLSRSEVHDGDLLVTITGNVGRVILLRGVGEANINQHIARVRVSARDADPSYVYHVLSQDTFRRRFESITTGQAYPQISLKQVRETLIPLPQLPEQRAIADSLSDVDALIEALDDLIAKKRAIKKAAMQQLLTGRTRLPGFSDPWKELNLGRDSILHARIGWQGLTTDEYLSSGEFYLVSGTDFIDGRVNWSSCNYVDKERYRQDSNIQLQKGDVLLTKDGTIGKAGLVDALPGPATLNSGVFVVRPKLDAYLSQYMYYVLTSRIFGEFLARLQAGSTISHLYQKDFVDFRFKAPSRTEQGAITEILSDMDADIASLEQRQDKIRMIKQGMMQQLLTGRVRLAESEAVERGPQDAELVR